MNKVLKMISAAGGKSRVVQRFSRKEKAAQDPLYSTLQESDEIRLLHLNPGSGGEPIECTLVHATLSDKPHYEALSYMWG